MTAKKNNKPTKELAVYQEPNVDSGISMKFTHHDITDVAISQKVEELEKEIAHIESTEQYKQQPSLYVQKLIDDALMKKPEVIAAIGRVKKAFPILDISNFKKNYSDYHDSITIEEDYMHIDDAVYNSTKAHLTLKKYTKENSETVTFYKRYNLDFKVKIDENISLSIDIDNVKLSDKEIKTLEKVASTMVKERAITLRKIYKMTVDLIQLQYNPEKLKSKFIREILNKTSEGKAILGLMEKASNTKLLIS